MSWLVIAIPVVVSLMGMFGSWVVTRLTVKAQAEHIHTEAQLKAQQELYVMGCQAIADFSSVVVPLAIKILDTVPPRTETEPGELAKWLDDDG